MSRTDLAGDGSAGHAPAVRGAPEIVSSVLQSLVEASEHSLSATGSAFRAWGTAGFAVGTAVAAAGALTLGVSVGVLAACVLASTASFFLYAWARRWRLVALDQIWLALGAPAALLVLAGEPVWTYLDLVGLGVCWFLAFGRVGCLTSGCCHGRPSPVGVAYSADALPTASRHLAEVRLAPVAAVEAVGLAAITAGGMVALPFAQPGQTLAGVLVCYGILRFALEGLRGDPRQHVFGVSRARWMCVAQVLAAAVAWQGFPHDPLAVAGLGAGAVAAIVGVRPSRTARRLTSVAHAEEVRAHALALGTEATLTVTSRGVAIARSKNSHIHVSLSMPPGNRDLFAACALAARALPELDTAAAHVSGRGVLHLRLETGHAPAQVEALYGEVVRRLQAQRAGGSDTTGMA